MDDCEGNVITRPPALEVVSDPLHGYDISLDSQHSKGAQDLESRINTFRSHAGSTG